MTLTVRGRIEIDKGSALADLQQVADAVKTLGVTSGTATAGASQLVNATNAAATAGRDAAQASQGHATAIANTGQQAAVTAAQASGMAGALDQAAISQRGAAAAADSHSDELGRQRQSLAALVQQYDPLAAAQGRAQAALAALNDLERAGTISGNELLVLSRNIGAEYDQTAQAIARSGAATQLNVSATEEDTRAKIANTAAAGRQRAAYQQLGFQVQDVFQGFALGVNPLVILAQQGGQVTSAFALMGAGADGAQTKFTRFMTFLSGPWGAAIFGAATVVGFLVQSMLNAEEAIERVEDASDGMAAAQSVLSKAFDQVTGAINLQNEALIINARIKAINLRADANAQQARSANALDNAGRLSIGESLLETFGLRRLRTTAETDRRQEQAQVLATRFRSANDILADPRARSKAFDAVLRDSEQIDFSGLAISKQEFQQAVVDAVSAEQSRQAADLIDKQLNQGFLDGNLRKAGGGGGRQPRSSGGGGGGGASGGGARGVDDNARAAQALLDFADQSADRIARINQQFGEQPRLVDLVARASQELADIQAEAAQKLALQPDALRDLGDAARDAQAAIDDALLRPLRQMEEAGARQLEQMALIVQGRESEAEALLRIQQYEERNGELTEEQRQGILAQVEAERELGRLIEDRGRKLSIYNASIDDTRAALEDLLSGGSGRDFLKSIEQNFKQLQGRLLTEELFGGALRELEDFASGRDSLKTQTEKLAEDLAKPGPVANTLASSMDLAADKINQAAQRIANPGLITGSDADIAPREGVVQGDGTILVNGAAPSDEPVTVRLDPTSFEFIQRLATSFFKAALAPLEDLIGNKLFTGLSEVFGGAVAGRAKAGNVGAILGGLKSIEGLPSKIKEVLGGQDGQGGAFGGAVAGFRTSLLLDSVGVGNSRTGAAIGGALGSLVPIPGGQIIGALAGGLIGQALKPAKRGSATITSVDGDATSRGNSQQRVQASLGLAGGVQERLRQIAQEFDAELGSFAVSIGQRGKNFRVDTSGQGRTKTKRGAIDFGQDEEAAVAFALRDAISDGAIKGLSAAIQQALNSSPDVDRAIKEALAVRDVEELLEGIGGAIRREVRDFDRQADERLRIARQYGFDIIEIERINAEERSKLVDDILQDRVGSLRDLLNDLVFGDLAEGSLSERRQRLLAEIAKAESEAETGVDGAADRLAELNRRLIALSRDAFGTAGEEFASDRAGAIASAERIIQIETDRIRSAQDATAETNRQLAQANQLGNEANDILAQINAGIRSLASLQSVNTGGGGTGGIDLNAVLREAQVR